MLLASYACHKAMSIWPLSFRIVLNQAFIYTLSQVHYEPIINGQQYFAHVNVKWTEEISGITIWFSHGGIWFVLLDCTTFFSTRGSPISINIVTEIQRVLIQRIPGR